MANADLDKQPDSVLTYFENIKQLLEYIISLLY